MKNIKIQKKAFTLVELIVVITILAILGTIAFISLQGNTQDAKNSKVLSDVASISKKISILSTKNTASLSTYLGTSVADNRQADGSI
jgi:prepilin-type N-terminal cleavage/methylation domain-containing protein